MPEAGIGRVLVASLHQGIADLLPTRLEFYENWLNPSGLRHGTIGLAPLQAVLSFLRREGAAYALVVDRAGEYAAEWTVVELSPLRRWSIRGLPSALRARAALRLARRLIRSSYAGSHPTVKLRRGTGRVSVRGSIFCNVRQPVPEPLCRYYAAAVARLFLLFDLEAEARVTGCLATGDQGCEVTVAVHGRAATVPAPAGTPS
jgi:hypothetical protein